MSNDRLTVETTNGPVRGKYAGEADVWLGLRYAAPPTGDLRFRHAREPHPWTEPADATRFGAVCPQPGMPVIDLGTATRQSEDCLYLNVWAPPGAAERGDHCAVMVWFHGGAYIAGSGSQPLYDGTSLVRTSVDDGIPTIIVTVNYRMGVFGFSDFSSMGSGAEQYDANCGMSDCLQALHWVHQNIERFGGDPSNVTIFGESAGGGIVTTLMAMPAAEGLFCRAIAQSSPATSVYDSERAARYARLVLDELGPVDRAPASSLRRAPVGALIMAGTRVFDTVPSDYPGTIAFAPFIDDDLIPRHPVEAIRSGDALDVPLMIGTNRDETSMFRWMETPLMPVTQEQVDAMFEFIAQERPDLAIPDAGDVLETAYAKGGRKSMRVSRDLGFRMPAIWIAEAHCHRAPVHLYRFDWATPLFRVLGIGATHATELTYVWGNPSSSKVDISYRLGGRKTGEKVSRRMQQRWLNYANHGNPVSTESTAYWDPYTGADQHSLLIGAEDTEVTGLDRNRLRAWGDDALSFG
ncbi:MAG: carboxylesterase/lipase family protein [Gordonia sp. (in: high G+C Gram-positive bacteria)]|uniref:carboxylesterase/lipase family protein n=1 Tax=Gordonia sp. (in: high G+C Gram-positive bacteria) TaxID=84139 RepID=UPI0039E2F72B